MPTNDKKNAVKKSSIKTGVVVSDKMNKTILVRMKRITRHQIYKKVIRRFAKVKVHDEKNAAKTGDAVRIIQAAPISKDKRWRLDGIIEKTKAKK